MHKRRRDRVIYTVLLLVCIVGFWVFENFYTPDSYSAGPDDILETEIPDFFIPSSSTGDLVNHRHYQLSYSERYEQAEWVIYTLNSSHLTNDDRERPDFIEDPYVKTKSAGWRNYRGSGYDRGHLCPAGDRRFSETAYRETFYTSNITPQLSEFNAGTWNDLEKQIRIWCRKYGDIYIATGGILEPGLKTIGDEDVAVPDWFYKIVAWGNEDKLNVLGFLFEHEQKKMPLQRFLVPVDIIEERSGIDFFKGLPDDLEERIEAEIDTKGWQFTAIR